MSIVVHSSANKAKDKKANKKPDVVFNEEKIEVCPVLSWAWACLLWSAGGGGPYGAGGLPIFSVGLA